MKTLFLSGLVMLNVDGLNLNVALRPYGPVPENGQR